MITDEHWKRLKKEVTEEGACGIYVIAMKPANADGTGLNATTFAIGRVPTDKILSDVIKELADKVLSKPIQPENEGEATDGKKGSHDTKGVKDNPGGEPCLGEDKHRGAEKAPE